MNKALGHWIRSAAIMAVFAGTIAAGQSLVSEEDLRDLGLIRYWRANVPLETGDAIDRVELLDDTLYVITDDGMLYTLSADTGLIRWASDITEPDYIIHPISHVRTASGNGPTLVATTTEMLIFDRYSGELIQRFASPIVVGGRVISDGDVLFAGGSSGRFHSFQLMPEFGQPPFKRWEVMSGGPVTASPLLHGRDLLLFASHGGKIYACRAYNKAFLWSARTFGPITGDPAVDETGVYVASNDRSLYKFELDKGRTVWRVQLPSPLSTGPTVVGKTVYQFCRRAGLIALEADTGTERWRMPAGLNLVSHTPNGDLVHTADKRIAVVDHESGKTIGDMSVPLVAGVVTNTRTDAGYLFSPAGRVTCLRMSSVPYLRRQQILSAQKNLARPPAGTATAPTDDPAQPSERPSDPFRSRTDGGR